MSNCARLLLVAGLSFVLAACGSRAFSPLPGGTNGAQIAPAALVRPDVPDVSGVYNGSVTESSKGRSLTSKLKITIRQSGDKFTGIFDEILKTLQDQFPIEKGVVVVTHGRTMLHFVIEGSPGRNAKAVASLVGKTIKGRAKVSAHNGPAVSFKYKATKA